MSDNTQRSTTSVSRKNLVLEVGDTGYRIECELRRHLSPRTVGMVMRSLPLRGNAHLMLDGSARYIETSIDAGVERPRTEFTKGDVAFLPSTGSLCFFIRDVSVSKKNMTIIGRLKGDLSPLDDLDSGVVLSLTNGTS